MELGPKTFKVGFQLVNVAMVLNFLSKIGRLLAAIMEEIVVTLPFLPGAFCLLLLFAERILRSLDPPLCAFGLIDDGFVLLNFVFEFVVIFAETVDVVNILDFAAASESQENAEMRLFVI